MQKYYVGITIGPIIETLNLASRPLSLWCASAMFSWLTEDLCSRAISVGGSIISPYYPQGKAPSEYSVVSDSVGKYHDRILFSVERDDLDDLEAKVKDMINGSKAALADELVSDELAKASGYGNNIKALKDAVTDHLQVRYVIGEKDERSDFGINSILKYSPYLDAAELSTVFSTVQTIQPIKTLFEGNSAGNDNKDQYEKHNELVKLCFGIGQKRESSLMKSQGKVRDIESIADSDKDSDRKIFNYYAVVQADGDNIGKLLESFISDEETRAFSKMCLEYTGKAAEMINDFGGMTIYAGGDDLLFISPLQSRTGKTLFELCNDINNVFKETFNDLNCENKPTVSFGISVNYKKYPLYEALKDSLYLLTERSKDVPSGKEKNRTTVRIRKGSGQSVIFRYANDSIVYKKLIEILGLGQAANEASLHSMLYKTILYRPILSSALKTEKDLAEVYKNLFDSEYHGSVETYIAAVKDALISFYCYVKSDPDDDFALEKIVSDDKGTIEERAIDLLCAVLRTAKFFMEKRGKDNG